MREISGRRGVSGGCTAGLVNDKKCPGSMILRAASLDVSRLDPRVDGTPVFRRKIEKCRRLVFSPGYPDVVKNSRKIYERLQNRRQHGVVDCKGVARVLTMWATAWSWEMRGSNSTFGKVQDGVALEADGLA